MGGHTTPREAHLRYRFDRVDPADLPINWSPPWTPPYYTLA